VSEGAAVSLDVTETTRVSQSDGRRRGSRFNLPSQKVFKRFRFLVTAPVVSNRTLVRIPSNMFSIYVFPSLVKVVKLWARLPGVFGAGLEGPASLLSLAIYFKSRLDMTGPSLH
jgi:hypothetical protein